MWVMVLQKKIYGPFLWIGFNCFKTTEPPEETVYFLSLSPQEVMVLIWSTSEKWKVDRFWTRDHWFGNQRPNH